MSSGLDHSRAAEAVLAKHLTYGVDELTDHTEYELQVAAVHAQLAVAGSVAALVRTFQRVFENDPSRAIGARIAQSRFTDRPTSKETKE